MAFTAIEIFALIILVLSLIKILVIFKNPMTWLNKVVKPMYNNPVRLQIVGLILGAGSLYYLLQVMSIVHIFAVMFFFSMILLVGITPYSKDMLSFTTKIYKQEGIMKRAWLSLGLWLILIMWALYELFIL